MRGSFLAESEYSAKGGEQNDAAVEDGVEQYTGELAGKHYIKIVVKTSDKPAKYYKDKRRVLFQNSLLTEHIRKQTAKEQNNRNYGRPYKHHSVTVAAARFVKGFEEYADGSGTCEKTDAEKPPCFFARCAVVFICTEKYRYAQQNKSDELRDTYFFVPYEKAGQRRDEQGTVADKGCYRNRTRRHSTALAQQKRTLRKPVQNAEKNFV